MQKICFQEKAPFNRITIKGINALSFIFIQSDSIHPMNSTPYMANELLRNWYQSALFLERKLNRQNFCQVILLNGGITVERYENNLVMRNRYTDHSKPTLMLNSHIDTVQPASGYSFDPFNHRSPTPTSTDWAATMPVPVWWQ